MPDEKERRESYGLNVQGSRSKRTIFRRTLFLMMLCGVVLFVPLFWKLWEVAIVHHEDYQQRASGQQTLDLSVTARRGNIYDRNGNVLAMSSTVYTLVLSPKDLEASVSIKDYADADGKTNTEAYAQGVKARQDALVRDLLALLPGLDEERLQTQVGATRYAYREIKGDISEDDVKAIRSYIVENKTSSYLYLISGSKRFYPYSSLAAQALGFVNAEGGAYGIEAVYDDVLQGTAGRVVTTKTASGVEMYNSYSEFIDAIDGYNLTLTIDSTIQAYAERILEEGIRDYDVTNGAFCLAMNPKTGAILAMANSPDFDPNNYSLIINDLLNEQLERNVNSIYQSLKEKNSEGLTDEELLTQAKAQAYSAAWNTQWRSKAINDLYEPGSTFKALVLAAALEEGLVSESDTFNCTGSYTVPGWPYPISCSNKRGHGHQTLAQAVQNSCNPAFMQIGQRLGIDRFYEYFEAFGMKEKTGIDLPGEGNSLVWEQNEMSGVDLAVASFGQRFEVTPLQMVAGFAATINGGKLVEPYIVQSISTKDGAVVKNTETNVVRQVVSQQTSDKVSEILESVVSVGTGKNAYQAGYRIGGKTGTSETKIKGEVIVSFMGFAPADDPEVLILLAYDRPRRASAGSTLSTTGVYISGGNMAAKKAGVLIGDILDYLGVEKQYTADESAAVDVSTPRVIGMTVSQAAKGLEEKNLSYRTVGQGDTITAQVPAPGAAIPGGSTVVLYLGQAVPEQNSTVPDVTGLSYEAARSKLEQAGLFMRSSGVSVYYGNTTTAESQSVTAGDEVAVGSVITVQFANLIVDGYVEVR